MKQRINLWLLAMLLPLGSIIPYAYPDTPQVIVNGVRLSPEAIRALEQQYGVRVQSGRYWYDRVSGLWGYEGGPSWGRIQPGLSLGGPLRPDVSGGNTGVFVNGRALHPAEVTYLQQCTPVYPGRYWLNAQGIVGKEGGPPLANLVALCQAANKGRGGRSSILGHSDRGSVIGGGGTTGYIGPDGTGVTCGPDGGCVYSRCVPVAHSSSSLTSPP